MQYIYLFFLIFSLSGLFFADYKHKLFIFHDTKSAILLWLIGLVFFLAWDVTGIVLDVFSTNPEWVSGVYFFTPDMPLEEILFLTLFLYNVVIAWRLVWRHTS